MNHNLQEWREHKTSRYEPTLSTSHAQPLESCHKQQGLISFDCAYVAERQPMLIQKQVKSIFHYSKKTGLFTNKIPRANGKIKAGQVNVSLKKGYIRLKISNKEYGAHRVAFLYVEGKMPKCDVDHKNGVRHDNRWSNIRPAYKGGNSHNCHIAINNTSGVKGVSMCHGKWLVRVKKGVKRYCGGSFTSIHKARRSANSLRRRLHGEYARHK